MALKDKNEPGRFLGEGVSFRAKLIGVLEVPEARGDRMCQDALADLKMAIRAAGEHKQRIQVHVAIDGLRLRDDKTGDSLYHHPVHKISFIAQDMTDSRAFGYIFGSPDSGHRFFGIKTDKAASQVVIAMRDLFQVVFELKKKEIELAKQQLEGKSVTSSLVRHTTTAADVRSKSITTIGETSTSSLRNQETEGGVAELVDLEQELSSLRRGLTQVEGLTPSSDPFGDSFILPSQRGLLPPPPSGSSSRGRTTPAAAPRTIFSPNKSQPLPFDLTANTEFEAAIAPAPLVDNIQEAPELKNPPKKVLKDLVPTQLPDIPAERPSDYQATMTSLSRHSGGTVSVGRPLCPGHFFTTVDPFEETDPFDSTDPFSESFKDDPFTSMQEFPKAPRDSGAVLREEIKRKLNREEKGEGEGRNVFNGPLQVTLPPEPVPKSPRLQRQSTTDTSSIRQRPQPSAKLGADSASPPPPLPPKKAGEGGARPPPRPPQQDDGPPLPRPVRKKEPLADRSMKPRLSSAATTSSEDEYLSPAPPPLPAARRFDITLSQLLTCTMDELAHRLRVPAAMLSSMTLPQLTDYLRSYLAADNDRAHIHIEPSMKPERDRPSLTIPISTAVTDKPPPTAPSIPKDFKPQFEDNFAPTEVSDTFVANFDDFDKKANPSYDRYAAFREIQEQELKEKSIQEPVDDKSVEYEPKQDSDEKEELAAINNNIMQSNQEREDIKENNRSPLKTLDELTLDSFNMFRKSVSPKPTQIDLKIEDIKSVMKNLQLEQSRRSVSPRENSNEIKTENTNDRYAALREITITEPPDEFESIPPEVPKERKRSDEKSDGFDNSDFFDCIDNSSLSFSHVDDAFRKSPVVKEKEEVKVEEKKEVPAELAPVRDLQPPARLSAGSISDVASGSSPDTKEKCASPRGTTRAGRWVVLGAGASPWSSDSRDSEPRHAWREGRRRRHHSPAAPRSNTVQTSSSSRDVSPWEEEPPPSRLQRPPSHHRDRESRHNSSGSRECLDSGSGREKDKLRDKRDSRDRDRDVSRDGRESRRDSGSGRDRRDVSKERDHRDHRRDRRSRDRDKDTWDRDRIYSRERDYRDSRSRERPAIDYREKERDRHRKPRHSYDEEEDYSDGCGSGRSSPRDRWSDQQWRRDDRNYGSLGWRETRRRNDARQVEDLSDRRYGTTLGWPARRSNTSSSRRESDRDTRDPHPRDPRDPRDPLPRSPRDPRDLLPRDPRDPRDPLPRDPRDPRDPLPRDPRDPHPRDPRDLRDPRDSRRRTRRDEPRQRPRDYRFSNDFSPRERDHPSPFDNDFQEPVPAVKKRAPYASLEGTRFAFEPEETTASPLSTGSARAHEPDSPATRFRFDSDSVSPRSMFEDDFTVSTPRGRTASIAEEDEDVPPLRAKPQPPRDIKKSESVNIFARESDPFESDEFFITGTDRAARRENWPGDFHGFDNA